ncbi:RNA-binding protein 25-like, partial [Trifolium medium]|nr:RNA-binding protein 25-like [Trifolium medium]
MRERVERETERGTRGRSRGFSKQKHHGYIHRVDQDCISFFISNFPEDCSSEDLWEEFARFGRVADVFIPKKVDKWGRRFGFVKYKEVKEMEVLLSSLQDVWIGSFKLRVNKSRFVRNEERRRSDTSSKPVQM